MNPPTALPQPAVPAPPAPPSTHDDHAVQPLLRDPPPPPGWVDPLQGSADLEDLTAHDGGTRGTGGARAHSTPASA